MNAPSGDRTAEAVGGVCLVILDGWGIGEGGPGDAVAAARTPVFDRLWEGSPHTTLTTSGGAVGLPEGQMGNSEVGHLNLGAGAIVKQDLTRIDDLIREGRLGDSAVVAQALTATDRVHLIGLVSDGGVHSSLDHLRALIELAGSVGTVDLVVHCFTDGRDTLPHNGAGYLESVQEWCASMASGSGRVGSVVGRYYAMDRDNRWERIGKAYDLLVGGVADHRSQTAVEAVRAAYERGETDEFVSPTAVGPEATIRPSDSVLAFNFRPDRMREITRALAEPAFGADGEELPGWEGRRGGREAIRRYATFTEYEQGWPYPVAFPSERPSTTLGSVIEATGASQVHVAETEKYPHVTYFFNGGREDPYEGERRELVPSPRDVPTYDLAPRMSAVGVTDAFVRAWSQERPRFAVINFANADMVGHTGVIEAAIAAVETVDECLGRVIDAVHASGGACVVTADHGNAERMIDLQGGGPDTAHTVNPVPLMVTGAQVFLDGRTGILADVAPTVLDLLGIDQPPEMSGRSLIDRPR